jgi:hypothetical protein
MTQFIKILVITIITVLFAGCLVSRLTNITDNQDFAIQVAKESIQVGIYFIFSTRIAKLISNWMKPE